MSFFIDWWALIVAGIACALISRLKPFYRKDGFLFYYLCAIVLVIFYTLSIGLLCDIGPEDNAFLGPMNQSFFALIKGDETSIWGPLAGLSPFKEYYANLTAWSINHGVAIPTSTEFEFSSGYEFIKCGAEGAFLEIGGAPIQINYITPIWLNIFPFRGGIPFNNMEQLVMYHPMYLFGGICMFCCYPAFLYIGTQLGYLLFGRKPGDKGIIYLI